MGEAKRRERANALASEIYAKAAARTPGAAMTPHRTSVSTALPPALVWTRQDGWRTDLLDVADPPSGQRAGVSSEEAVALDGETVATFTTSWHRRAATVCVFDGDRGGYSEWFMWASFAVDWNVEIAAAWKDGRIRHGRN